jgi:hypothetical protein
MTVLFLDNGYFRADNAAGTNPRYLPKLKQKSSTMMIENVFYYQATSAPV